MTNQNKKTKEKKPPALRAFHVREGKDGGKGFWSSAIGAAWAHEDGNGFNLQLDMVPLDGKIVLRTVKADEATEGEGA
jgi:hypothetical protein